MRQFTGLLFLGNGSESVKHVRLLKKRLVMGLASASAMQQGDSDKSQAEVGDVVRDIAAALLGRSIRLGAKLLYPPRRTDG